MMRLLLIRWVEIHGVCLHHDSEYRISSENKSAVERLYGMERQCRITHNQPVVFAGSSYQNDLSKKSLWYLVTKEIYGHFFGRSDSSRKRSRQFLNGLRFAIMIGVAKQSAIFYGLRNEVSEANSVSFVKTINILKRLKWMCILLTIELDRRFGDGSGAMKNCWFVGCEYVDYSKTILIGLKGSQVKLYGSWNLISYTDAWQ